MTDTTTEDDDIEIIEVDTLPAPGAAPPAKAAEDDDKDDDKGDEPDDDDDEPEEDERLADKDEETPDPKRQKRIKRREVQKRAKEAAQAELRMLREQNAEFQRRLSAVETNSLQHNETLIDARLSEAKQRIRDAESIHARAIEAGNGDDAVAALRLRDAAAQEAQDLERAKKGVETARTAPPPADSRVQSLGKQWMDANPWYDPKGSNEDSAITNAIDATLVREGFNPASTDYWQELTRRVSARLNPAQPRAREDRVTDPGKKRAPPIGASQEHVPTSTRREVYVTPERKQAMMDAGYWDDPVKRKQMLKTYAEYDRNGPQ